MITAIVKKQWEQTNDNNNNNNNNHSHLGNLPLNLVPPNSFYYSLKTYDELFS